MSEELMNIIKDLRAEEYRDHDHYGEIIKMAEKEGCDDVAGLLTDIEYEESTHANILDYILDHFE